LKQYVVNIIIYTPGIPGYQGNQGYQGYQVYEARYRVPFLYLNISYPTRVPGTLAKLEST